MNPKDMIKKMAQMMNFQDNGQLDGNIDKAIAQAQSGNPLEGMPIEFLKQIRSKMNNPLYAPLFAMAKLNKESCKKYLDEQIMLKSGTPTSNGWNVQNKQTNKYIEGLKQFK